MAIGGRDFMGEILRPLATSFMKGGITYASCAVGRVCYTKESSQNAGGLMFCTGLHNLEQGRCSKEVFR